MTVVSRLCGKMEPQDSSLPSCIESLSSLLKHDDPFVSDSLVWMLIFAFLRNGLDVSYLNLIRVPLLHPGAVIFCHLTFFSLHFCKAYTASFTVICLHGTLPLYLTDEFLWSSVLEARGHHHLHCSHSLSHHTRLATELSVSLLPVCGMNYHTTAHLNHPYFFMQSSKDSSLNYFFLTLCSACEVAFVIMGQFDHFFLENGWYGHSPIWSDTSIRVYTQRPIPIPIPIRVLLVSWCPSHLYH